MTEPQTAAEEPPHRRPGRVRVTGVTGALAALAVGASFFLAWITVEPALGREVRKDLDRALARADITPAVERDFTLLADTLASDAQLSGTDLIQWVRTATAYNAELDAKAAKVGPVDAAMQRRWQIARVVLYGLPICGFLLAAYFLFHRFRRAVSPILILSLLTGSTAVVLAGALDYSHALVQRTLGGAADDVHLGAGVLVLLAGGTLLTLAGIFGVSTRNWIRVYAGSVLTGACLVVMAVFYLKRGFGS